MATQIETLLKITYIPLTSELNQECTENHLHIRVDRPG